MNAKIMKKGHQLVCHDCWRSRVWAIFTADSFPAPKGAPQPWGLSVYCRTWIQSIRPRATGRIEFSARLLLISNLGLGITGYNVSNPFLRRSSPECGTLPRPEVGLRDITLTAKSCCGTCPRSRFVANVQFRDQRLGRNRFRFRTGLRRLAQTPASLDLKRAKYVRE